LTRNKHQENPKKAYNYGVEKLFLIKLRLVAPKLSQSKYFYDIRNELDFPFPKDTKVLKLLKKRKYEFLT
jgi:hypothetical protein